MDISAWRLPTGIGTTRRGQPNPEPAHMALFQGIVWTDKSARRPVATDGKLTGLQELVTWRMRTGTL